MAPHSPRAPDPRPSTSQPLEPLALQLPATPASVSAARRAVADYSSGQALDHAGIAIAVSEAVTNAVLHAYRDGEPGPVHLSASFADGSLVVVVSDDGQGMTPRTDSTGMGVGLVVIAQLATLLEIDGNGQGHGTRVTMSFARAG